MKQCPTCNSIIEAQTECPVCGETLTYVNPHPAHRERIARNRYGLRYLAKQIWFALLCTATAVLLLLFAGWHDWRITTVSLLCCAAALIRSFFSLWLLRRWRSRLAQSDYHTETYRRTVLCADKYLAAVLGVAAALIPYFLPNVFL
ncbi:MAG: hypothetical protein IKD37_08955 [Clostridia bacterium]|nr:hypothetical protein [Clostridia bacterium]